MPLKLRLIREPSRNGFTTGVLFANGVFQNFIGEDQIREVPGQPVTEWKVKGNTAIPAGTYRIVLQQSARFGRLMPYLIRVPGFDAIEIHWGNKKEDTEGCLLTGLIRGYDSVGGSKQAFEALIKIIEANQPVTITIENPEVL